MKAIITRINSQAGETLVESMAAILIFTFASIIMLSMVSSAADINASVKEADREYFEDMVIVELAEVSSTGNVSLSIMNSTGTVTINAETTAVSISGDANGLYAYYAASSTPEGGGST